MNEKFEILNTTLYSIEEYKRGNINRTTLELIIKGSFELIEQLYKYDYSKNCKCDSRIGETWCCNQCGLPVSK